MAVNLRPKVSSDRVLNISEQFSQICSVPSGQCQPDKHTGNAESSSMAGAPEKRLPLAPFMSPAITLGSLVAHVQKYARL